MASATVQAPTVLRSHCRVESLDEDMAGLMALLNDRRPPGLPELAGHVGWDQKGPLVKAAPPADTSPKQSRHADKYAACGAPCFAAVARYYAQDFATLQYPSVEDA